MKSIKYSIYALSFLLMGACTQDVIDLKDPCEIDPASCAPDTSCNDASGKTGTADFTKLVTIGNSFVAGVQAGALFTEGQNNSLAVIINKQMDCVRGSESTFNQPDIKATLGWNLFVPQPFLANNANPVLGRLLLQYGTTPDCTTGKVSPKPTPQQYPVGIAEAVPSPANANFLFTGSKATLNNFGVPAIVLGQALISQTGDWSGAAADPRFTPFYGRLAYPGTGTSTIIGDAAAAGGSFFVFWLGLDDFFLHAAFGADPAKAPLTSNAAFGGQYNAALGALLASNANLKGVVGNFPDIFVMPHFTSVTYNPIPLAEANVGFLMSANAFGGYNAALDGLIANAAAFGISDDLKAEIATRKVIYTVSCNNKILITDETLTDLGPYFDGLVGAGAMTPAQRTALTPYQRVRQSAPTDVFPLAAGSIIGTLIGGDATKVNGLSIPLADQYVIIPSEKDAINAARTSFNASVQATVDANSTRLALADVSTAMATLVTNRAGVYNGVTITPNINPPTGIYSEDGVHPNSRGYAFISLAFINAINAKFGSEIPLTKLSSYSATGLPIQP